MRPHYIAHAAADLRGRATHASAISITQQHANVIPLTVAYLPPPGTHSQAKCSTHIGSYAPSHAPPNISTPFPHAAAICSTHHVSHHVPNADTYLPPIDTHAAAICITQQCTHRVPNPRAHLPPGTPYAPPDAGATESSHSGALAGAHLHI